MFQARKRRSVQTQQRRSSATTKPGDLQEGDAGPSSPALPAHHMTDDAQQDKGLRETSQGGATPGSPLGEDMDMHADIAPHADEQSRGVPQTFVSRISRIAGIFTGRRSTAEVPTGEFSTLHEVWSDYICWCQEIQFSMQASNESTSRPFVRHQQLLKGC